MDTSNAGFESYTWKCNQRPCFKMLNVSMWLHLESLVKEWLEESSGKTCTEVLISRRIPR